MMLRGTIFSFGVIVILAGASMAQVDPAAAAREAARKLEAATDALNEAEGARNRVRALTQTLRAYEDALAAMREGLRRAAVREAALERELRSREEETAQLLGVLQTMSGAPAPSLLLHPAGPVGTARSGMILAEVTPALNRRAEELRRKLDEMRVLGALRETAAEQLKQGLIGAQEARVALSQAIADRTGLPRRFSADPVRAALLVAATESMKDFAAGLGQIAVDEVKGSLPGISDRKGELPLPVRGRILRRAEEPDAAGISRPGILIATRPGAVVTTPAAATLRYRGPLLDYGKVAILEPEAGILLVIAGLDVIYGETGQVLPGGSPVGLMGGVTHQNGAVVTAPEQETGAQRSETLYIEVRKDNSPVDPEDWFRTDKDE